MSEKNGKVKSNEIFGNLNENSLKIESWEKRINFKKCQQNLENLLLKLFKNISIIMKWTKK